MPPHSLLLWRKISRISSSYAHIINALLFIIVVLLRYNFTVSAFGADVVAIIPDRSTPYPNGVYNGLRAYAHRYNISLEVRNYGNFDQNKFEQILKSAKEQGEQPRVYCIWPVDTDSRELVGQLHNATAVPIIQMNQLPGEDMQWEWNHLLGYVGPSDAERANNAGVMLAEAMVGRNIDFPKVIVLGYPKSYGGYGISISSFRRALEYSDIEIVKEISLEWGSQSAYDAMVQLLDEKEFNGLVFHGIYAMDDNILGGAYQALFDRGVMATSDRPSLIGTVCNGARELLVTGSQYGTTCQAPYLEGALAIDSVQQYMISGTLNEVIRFIPNPVVLASDWEKSLIIEFLGEVHIADDLCTWNHYYERSSGLLEPSQTQNACNYIDCLFVPEALFVTGYVMAGTNYVLCFLSAMLLFIYRNKKVVRLAQPAFLGLVIFGALIDTTSIIFMSRDNRFYSNEELEKSCLAWPILLAIGSMMTTATLVAKIYRVKAVTGAGEKRTLAKRTKVTAKDVSGFIVGGLTFDAIILSIWLTTDPYTWSLAVQSRDMQGFILEARGECRSEGRYYWVYPLVMVVVHFGFLVYANILAYQTRKFHSISDSRTVAICLFNSIQLILLVTVLVALVDHDMAISYLIRISYAFLNNFGTIIIVVVPKLCSCLRGEGDTIPSILLNVDNAHDIPEVLFSPVGSVSNGSDMSDSATNDTLHSVGQERVGNFGSSPAKLHVIFSGTF